MVDVHVDPLRPIKPSLIDAFSGQLLLAHSWPLSSANNLPFTFRILAWSFLKKKKKKHNKKTPNI